MSWTTSTDELRTLLNDGTKDRLRWMKTVIGYVDGVNTTFKTFEFRRLSNFVAPTAPSGVFVNGVSAVVSGEDLASGAFTLAVAPAQEARVEATYYAQWFIDTELDEFLVHAVKWLGLGADPTLIPDGLQPSSLKYAAAEAYQKIAVHWATNRSETYRMEDSPDPNTQKASNPYAELAKQFFGLAQKERAGFYTRQDQAKAPLVARVIGSVRSVVPKR